MACSSKPDENLERAIRFIGTAAKKGAKVICLPELFRSNQGLARLFLAAFRRGLCDGLYLTAGVPRHPARAMARLVEIVELLRGHYGFRGYIHVKAVAGAPAGPMQKLVHLADRVSSHLEPACRHALLTVPSGPLPKGLDLYASPDAAATELRRALAESARQAPGPLPPPGALGRKAGQLALFRTGSRFVPGGYASS